MGPQYLLPLLLLLLLLLILSPPTTTSAATTTVLDINGHPLRADTEYFILPVFRGRGGGLTLLPKNDTASCPLFVGQEFQEISSGLPIKLFPVNPKQKLISLSSDLNFVFEAASICITSNTWQLVLEEETGRRLVGSSGSRGNPGVKTVSNWFKIEKAGSGKFDYKIVYCPSVCNFCKVMCGDLGVFIEKDGRRLLGFTDQPLLVMFKKVQA